MPDWRDEYLVNIQEAERNNPVNRDLVAACEFLIELVVAKKGRGNVGTNS